MNPTPSPHPIPIEAKARAKALERRWTCPKVRDAASSLRAVACGYFRAARVIPVAGEGPQRMKVEVVWAVMSGRRLRIRPRIPDSCRTRASKARSDTDWPARFAIDFKIGIGSGSLDDRGRS